MCDHEMRRSLLALIAASITRAAALSSRLKRCLYTQRNNNMRARVPPTPGGSQTDETFVVVEGQRRRRDPLCAPSLRGRSSR